MSLVRSLEFERFRSWVALRKVSVDPRSSRLWRYFEWGPVTETPLILLHGASGTAETFYRQMMSLCPKGHRIISAQYPHYETHLEWVQAFDRFLNALQLDKVHLFGTTLGGYLALCYAQICPLRTESIVLCNSFIDTQRFAGALPFGGFFSFTPKFLLEGILMQNFPSGSVSAEIADSVDFMVQQLKSVKQSDLASRINLNCTKGPFVPSKLQIPHENITIIDANDEVSLPEEVKASVYSAFPEAAIGKVKNGGNFPFLSFPEEVNLFLEVHLRRMKVKEEARAALGNTKTEPRGESLNEEATASCDDPSAST